MYFYVLITNVKFHIYWILFTIQFINIFFMHYFKLQKFEI